MLRAIRENVVEYVITLRGEPVAILWPLTEEEAQWLRQSDIDKELAEMRSLADKVAASWTSPKSGVDLVSEQRM